MEEPTTPLKRSIGLGGVLAFLVAVTAVIAVAAAWYDGRYAVAGIAAVFFVGATVIGVRLRRRA